MRVLFRSLRRAARLTSSGDADGYRDRRSVFARLGNRRYRNPVVTRARRRGEAKFGSGRRFDRGAGRQQVSRPDRRIVAPARGGRSGVRSEEHTSELQSLMRISYAVFCLKKKKTYIYLVRAVRA